MWRAFFFATGVVFVILGLQCLVVDRFFVTQEGRLGSVANKALNLLDKAQQDVADAAESNQNLNFSRSPFQANASAYGPSRFSASPYSAPTGGFGQAGFQSAGFQTPSTATKRLKPPRDFQPADWMPWSLLAVGTIIVLYTKSTGGFSHNYSGD